MSTAPTIRRATALDVPRLAKLFDLYRQFYRSIDLLCNNG